MNLKHILGICKKPWLIFITIVIIILGFLFYRQSQIKKENGIKTHTISRMDLKEVVSASGKITARDQATLRFQAGGYLAWVGVKKGDKVQKWQAIASLDERQLQKSLRKELIDYQTERIDFDSDVDTNDAGITSRNYLDIQTRGDEDLSLMRLL